MKYKFVRGKRIQTICYDDAMSDQERLEFQAKLLSMRDKYKDNPLAWIKDFHPEIKLYPWQEAFLKAMYVKDKVITYFNPYRYGKEIIHKMQVEHWKAMGYDFNLWTKNGLEVYEKGVLVKTIRKDDTYDSKRTTVIKETE